MDNTIAMRWVLRRVAMAKGRKRCQFCGLKEGVKGYRDKNGVFCNNYESVPVQKRVTIKLTIAHRDHDLKNWNRDNLIPLCHKCNRGYNLLYHRMNRSYRRDEGAGQPQLIHPEDLRVEKCGVTAAVKVTPEVEQNEQNGDNLSGHVRASNPTQDPPE